jgi:hypothetical protein
MARLRANRRPCGGFSLTPPEYDLFISLEKRMKIRQAATQKMKAVYLMTLFALMNLAVRAQAIIPMQTLPAWTALVQNTNVMDNGKTTTVPAPAQFSITAKTLLAIIAQDEYREGNYASNSFPSGAKLVLMADLGSFADSYYSVQSKSGQILVTNLSDLMSLQVAGNFTVYSYVVNDATGLGGPIINDYIGTLNFDDTGAGGTMKFNLSRLVAATVRDSALSNGTYTETVTTTWGVGNGTGNINGNNAVIYSTTETENGRGTFRFP